MRYLFDDFVLDAETGELLRAGEVIVLRRQTFRLLKLLVERAPALLERDTLLDEVWGRTALAPNAVPQAISELRRALGDGAQSPRDIETRHRQGYRFLSPVSRQTASSGDTEVAGHPPSVTPQSGHVAERMRQRRWLALWGVVVVVLVLVAVQNWSGLPAKKDDGAQLAGSTRTLALSALPADADVPSWVSAAALELFVRHLSHPRLRLVRPRMWGRAGSAPTGKRWQREAHGLLGADFAISGRWSLERDDVLGLDLSIVELGTGRLVTRERLTGRVDELDALSLEAIALIGTSLELSLIDAQGAVARPRGRDRTAYWSAVALLERGQGKLAAEALTELHGRLGKPDWIEPVLIDSLVQSGRRDEALALIDVQLGGERTLPPGQRLRLQANAAALRYQPAHAAAALRALVELYPGEIESWMHLAESELDALQGMSARSTVLQLAGLPATRNDPRLNLLRSRLSRLDNDLPSAAREADTAMQIAVEYDLPTLAISASVAQSDALRAEGKLDAAARALESTDALWSTRVESAAMFDLRLRRVQLLREQGKLDDAGAILDQLRSVYVDDLPQAWIGVDGALLDALANQPAKAFAELARIRPTVDGARDPDLSIAWLNAEANAALAGNDATRARQSFESASALARKSGRAGRYVGLQVNAGIALMRQGRFTEADTQWQQALDVFEALGDRRGQATCLGNLAASASTQGSAERGVELNQQALSLFRELHLTGPQARTAYNLALGATREGRLDQARTYYSEASDVWRADGQHDMALRAAVGLADIALLSGDFGAAERIVASTENVEQASPLSQSHLLALQSQIAALQGRMETARSLQQQALRQRKQDGNDAWIALSELELRRIDLLQGSDATGVQIEAERLAGKFAKLRESRDEARAWLLVADAQLSRGNRDGARRSLENVKVATARFPDNATAFDIEWAGAWLADHEERILRLRALRDRANEQGYRLHAMRAAQALGSQTSSGAPPQHLRLPVPPYARRAGTGSYPSL